ncbi:MAG TPA: hypothetical protein DHW85_10950, partial [Lachnospiraceae bacterium]|nr:hypothetical protein [Lachnospiraceae bacterium]
MKKRMRLLVISLSLLMLLGGCGKKEGTAKDNTENQNTESDKKDAEGAADTAETNPELITVTKEDYNVKDYITL